MFQFGGIMFMKMGKLRAGAMSIAVFVSLSVFAAEQPAIVGGEFVFEAAPFPSCHAPTIVETPRGLVCAWFGGQKESAPDVGIWCARIEDGKWTAPVEVANGIQSQELRYPCWNPVLFYMKDGNAAAVRPR